MATRVKVPAYAVALVVLGGAIWVFAGVAYGAQVVSCMSCGSVVVAPGIDTSGYSPDAVRTLAWDALYASLYVATVGLLAIAIGLTAFRRGERWAWYAIAVFATAGVLTAFLDELAWGGWYTFLFLGLVPFLGVVLSVRSFFGGERVDADVDRADRRADGGHLVHDLPGPARHLGDPTAGHEPARVSGTGSVPDVPDGPDA
jgi:hypothetical protein